MEIAECHALFLGMLPQKHTVTDCAFELVVEPFQKRRECLLLGGELGPLRFVLIFVTILQPFLGHILQCQTSKKDSLACLGKPDVIASTLTGSYEASSSRFHREVHPVVIPRTLAPQASLPKETLPVSRGPLLR